MEDPVHVERKAESVMTDQEYLDKLHIVLQEILDHVCQICEEQGFTYFLAYGTALGARRHKGFIPWDDDIDIVMPRDDLEAFMRYMKEHEDPGYSLQFTHNEKRYFLYFPKVRKNNTLFLEGIAEGVYQNNGIYIDIFPLEYVDEKNVKKIPRKYKVLNMLKHFPRFIECRAFFKAERSRLQYLADCIFSIPFRLMNRERYIAWLNRDMSSDGTPKTGTYMADYDTVLGLMKKEVYFPPARMEFEGTLYNVPNKIDEYLTNQYGSDYMELPPEEERVTHAPKEIRF